MPRRAALACLTFLISLVGCAGASGPEEVVPPPPPPPDITVHYVAPGGDDSWEGSKERPFATIAKALQQPVPKIVLLGGTFEEPEINIDKEVMIEGLDGDRSVLLGHVYLSAEGVELRRLELQRGLAVHRASAALAQLKVEPGDQDDAISIVSSTAQLKDVQMSCGAETCLQITTSTATVEGAIATGQVGTKRGVRVESSSVSIDRIEVRGASTTQLQASLQSYMSVQNATLLNSEGSALAALQGSTLQARSVRVEGAARFGVLLQSSAAHISSSTVAATGALTVGITGGKVTLENMRVEAGPEGTLSVTDHSRSPAEVTLRDCRVEHGARSGVLMASGRLTIAESLFVGAADPQNPTPLDAITISGIDSTLTIRGTTLSQPAGFGITVTNDAGADIQARIEMPGAGGVFVDGVMAQPVVLQELVVDRCRSGSGVVVFRSQGVRLTRGQVQGCPEAGLLAGDQSAVQVVETVLSDNQSYGLAAFGGAQVQLQDTRISGSKWAVFASCGDGARVEDLGGNQLKGPVSACP